MVVENVKGAQPWVGKAKANFGSFYLWGDVESVGGRIIPAGRPKFGVPALDDSGRKNGGGSWFNIAHNTESGHGQNPDGRKLPNFNFHEHEKTGQPEKARGWNERIVTDRQIDRNH
jgi:hypothetical protein